jgi:two-component system cell cycle sensor histidine kinase/response regulator CckA
MSGPLRLLLVDDSESDQALLLAHLRRSGWEVSCERVETGEQMRAALERSTADLIISDNRMPAFSAAEALALWRERCPDTPFVIVSGTIGEEQAVELMKGGAHDFLLKDRLSRLDSAVERALADAAGKVARRQLETQLRQGQKMEAIGRLAGGVAHDFNNILGVIQGEAHLLLQPLPADDPRRAGLEQILFATERAAALTQQLLAFSKSQVLEVRPIDLNVSVARLAGMLDRLVGSRVEVVFERRAASGRVRADPSQIEQVLMNLAVNARDAMPDGGRLRIATAEEELAATSPWLPRDASPGRYISLTVSDTGHGMSEAVQARAFEPFFTTKGAEHGTGLGLATVYGIVAQSGGFIHLESPPGGGTTFRIFLPRAGEEEGAAPSESAAPGESPASLAVGETVLLAEDQPALCQLIAKSLERRGYRVLAAEDSSAALAAAEGYAGEIHLLLTDISMPGMGGRELADRLSRIRPGVRVLYMSGYPQSTMVERGEIDSDALVITKPFTMESLTRKLREALGPLAGGDAGARPVRP